MVNIKSTLYLKHLHSAVLVCASYERLKCDAFISIFFYIVSQSTVSERLIYKSAQLAFDEKTAANLVFFGYLIN